MARIAVISDVHGNLTAFQAVLEDAKQRGVTEVWCAGDLVGKGPRGRAVVELAQQACDVVVRGNWDEAVAVPDTVHWDAPDWYRDELGEAALAWLGALPLHHDAVLAGQRVRLFHASPVSVHHRVRAGMDDEAYDGMFAETEATGPVGAADLVVYGDLHRQFVDERRGRRLVNTGSAGNALEGDPRAAYVVLEETDDGVDVTHVCVPYDTEQEIAIARDCRIPFLDHWVAELETAVYRPRM